MNEKKCVSWEHRPAVLEQRADGTLRAWAVLERGGSWVEVDAPDVFNSGALMAKEDSNARFADWLPPS